jgi:hypothetical protein
MLAKAFVTRAVVSRPFDAIGRYPYNGPIKLVLEAVDALTLEVFNCGIVVLVTNAQVEGVFALSFTRANQIHYGERHCFIQGRSTPAVFHLRGTPAQQAP